jgi:hypothetical protein
VGALLDPLWSAFDQDDPLFCECRGSRVCTDCALGAAVDGDLDWACAPAAAPIAAA